MRYLEKKQFDGSCRWCGSRSIPPPRRTFCSPECVHQYRLRTSSQYIRECVYTRDRGVCAICGTDTKEIAKQIQESKCPCTQTKTHYKRKKVKVVEHTESCKTLRTEHKIGTKRKVWRRKNGGGLWDADHIVRVEHGGGVCGMDNLRTLCLRCHKDVT
jgi:5-methylcytosine-specific restriction protein A